MLNFRMEIYIGIFYTKIDTKLSVTIIELEQICRTECFPAQFWYGSIKWNYKDNFYVTNI